MLLPHVIGLVAAVAAWFSFRGAPILPLDDAYIHLVYARSLAESGVLRFNPSDPPSLGSSSPLWVAILAATHRLGVDLVTAALALDLVAFALLVALTIDSARVAATALGLSPRRVKAVALLAGLVVATNGNLLWLSLSGMETLPFLALSLAAVRLYHRQGFSLATGVACGLVALTRLPGGLLAVLFLALDLLRRRSGWHRGVLTTALVVLPYFSWTLRVTGQLLPTPAAGKLATYAERGLQPAEIFWFLRALVTYELWVPQTLALAALAALGLLVLFRERRRVDALTALLALWALSHIALYAVTFRLVHQHGRYVAELHVILALLGSVALGLLGRRVAVVSAAAVLALAAWTLPSWHAVYAGNVAQMERVGLRMATYVRDTTPVDSRVACFDIGALGWASTRYVIDLGGLVDPNLHPYLKERACAPYLRQKRATHLIDLRNVETDWMNGLFPAEREGVRLLTLTRLKTFEIPPYDVPSVTNSVALDLYEVRSFRASPENVLVERAAPSAASPVVVRDAGHGLSLVAAGFTPGLLTPLRYMGGRVELSLVWRAEEPLKEPLYLHVTGTLPGTGLVFAWSARVMPALEPSRWPAGALLRETIRMPLSADTPDGEVTFVGVVTTEERASVRERTGERAVPLGSVVVRRSPFAPRDIYTLRTAAALRRQRRQLDVLAHFPER